MAHANPRLRTVRDLQCLARAGIVRGANLGVALRRA
jgi:hypothetical protein